MSEVTKWLSNRTENGKCTDVTNRRSRVGLSTPIYSIFAVPHTVSFAAARAGD